MNNERLNDMLERYGEICTQAVAAKILGVVPRTISRMCVEGRLRKVGHRVDVRSICAYIEDPKGANFTARAEKAHPKGEMSRVLGSSQDRQMGSTEEA